MQVVRRVYVYLLAFAGLLVLAFGVADLGRILVEALLGPPTFGDERFFREQLAGSGAMAVVGLPVWLFHWWLAQRSSADPEERASALRRLYLYAALAWSLLVGATSLAESLGRLLSLLLGERERWDAVLAPLPMVLVGAVIWAFHWRVTVRDRRAVDEEDASATLRRWYVYGSLVIGFLVMLSGAQQTLAAVWEALAGSAGPLLGSRLSDTVPATLIGLAIWLIHARWVPGILTVAARRDDERSTLRAVAFFVTLAVVVAGTLFGVSQLLYYALARAFGVDRPGGVSGSLLQAAAGPASVALIYGLAWAYQRYAVEYRSLAAATPHQAGVRRLYTYLVALLALAAFASGAAGLLWAIADALLVSPTAADPAQWRDRLALFGTLLVVGFPVWLGHWRASGTVRTEEARSLARRLYGYLALIGGALALLGSAAWAVNLLLNLALGTASPDRLGPDLAHALAVALVAALVAVYHWQTVRTDARLGAEAAPPPPAPGPAPATSALVRLRTDDPALLEGVLKTLEEHGVQVERVAEDR